MTEYQSKTEVTFVPGSAAGIKCEVISPREVLPRLYRGVDWCSERIVIARTKDSSKQLWWQKSGSYWSGSETKIFKAILVLAHADEPGYNQIYPFCYGIQEGGRLSKKLLRSKAKEINEFFGCSIAQFLDITTTTVIVKTPRSRKKKCVRG